VNIKDKVVLISGGASGLGLAAAKSLVKEKGAKVALLDLNEEAGRSAVAEIGEPAMYLHADVVSEEAVQQAVSAVIARFGAIHANINCAAILGPAKVLDRECKARSLASFTRTVMVNLVGLFNVMGQCVEQMAKNDPEGGEERGVVINISSISGTDGQIGQCAYSASKAGVVGLQLPAARELVEHGIRVNAIAPGLFLTPMASQLDPKALERLKSQVESPRRMGEMEEFAHCCAFIIENGYMNAETVRLDGATRLRAR
jgi:3-hydroxyacyl-CoA dehydrogenase / 3-hydroxy-2-methylbutyryl-CoA dehydrogenase